MLLVNVDCICCLTGLLSIRQYENVHVFFSAFCRKIVIPVCPNLREHVWPPVTLRLFQSFHLAIPY